MCFVAAIPLIAAALGAATSIYSADQQRRTAHEAQDAQKAAADAAAVAPGTQQAKAPDTSTMNNAAGMGDNANSGSAAATLLTGAGGIDPNNLQLGRNSLGGLMGGNTLLGA